MEAIDRIEWFALQTKPGAESVAVHTLSTLGLETFLPMARSASFRAGRRIVRARPLFPNYCFARFRVLTHLHAVRFSRGVWRVVGTPNQPWAIADDILEDIRSRLDDDGMVDLADPTFRKGDSIRVCHGPLAGWAGIFDGELDDRARVVIFLDAIQPTRALINREWIELAEAV